MIRLLILCIVISFSAFAKERKALEGKVLGEVNNVFKANEELHQAFFDNKSELIKASVLKVKSAYDQISDQKIKKLLTFSMDKLASVSKDGNTNNQNYHLFSMALIHIMNTYKIDSAYNAYSCPMVKKKWIQNSKTKLKVHNPYASSSMPYCGDKDTQF